jgi:hypothetical protein
LYIKHIPLKNTRDGADEEVGEGQVHYEKVTDGAHLVGSVSEHSGDGEQVADGAEHDHNGVGENDQ